MANKNEKLYLVVDSSLSYGQKVAQLVHGMRAWSENHPKLDKIWYQSSNTVVCLEAPSEKMEKIISKAIDRNIEFASFSEPDLDYKLTCVVLSPNAESSRLCKNLPLVG